MIIPMKKVTLLCMEQDKSSVLEHLRELELMQLIPSANVPSTADVEQLSKIVADAERAFALIRSATPVKHPEKIDGSPEQLIAGVLALAEKQASEQKQQETLKREQEALAPWGEFSQETIRQLKEKGVYVALCRTTPDSFAKREKTDGVSVNIVHQDKTAVCFALISTDDAVFSDPDVVQLPVKTLSQITSELETVRKALAEDAVKLASYQSRLSDIKNFGAVQNSALEFATARDGMAKEGVIAWLSGFVPETEIAKLKNASLEYGWALLLEDPSADDVVPTYIKKPKFLNIMDPLFDIIGIQPGYRENDVYLFFLIFFPIFFGIIVGDAGYGTLFLIAAITGKIILRNKEKARLPLNLLIFLSLATIAWGWINGSWLGLPRTILPPFMRGWKFIADPGNSATACRLVDHLGLVKDGMTEQQIKSIYDGLPNKFMQYFCFILAAFHLGSARLFKFLDEIPHTWRAIGHLGWGCLIVANFFLAADLIVFSGTFPKMIGYPLYGVGLVLIVITTRGIDFMNLPSNLISSFVDVLSYIRLFAVGLAGSYVAVNFNMMGGMLMHALPAKLVFLGVILLTVVVILGHALNIGLNLLSVMVHAVRLNTLEFSNHVGMEWAGIKFHPFASLNQDSNQKQKY